MVRQVNDGSGPKAIADQLRVHTKAVADMDLDSSILSALRLAQ